MSKNDEIPNYFPNPHPPKASLDSEVGKLRKATPVDLELHYHKGLAHRADGQVDPDGFEKLRQAVDEHYPADFSKIVLGAGIKSRSLVNPQSGFSADRQCAFAWHFKLPKAPEHNQQSETAAAEMIELYWMSKLRDVPFDEWEGNPLVVEAVAELKDLPLYLDPGKANKPTYRNWEGLSVQTLFRGGDLLCGDDAPDHIGPMISQFLWQPVPYGAQSFDQKERRRVVSDQGEDQPKPHLTRWADWLKVQNGNKNSVDKNIEKPETPEYLHGMAGLARYVHLDKLYQAYLNAAFIMIGAEVPVGPGNPYGENKKEEGFGTFGVPHVLSLVTEVATRALKAVWYQKWVANLRMRPEAYSGLVHRALLGKDGDGGEHFDENSIQQAKEALGKDGLAVLEKSLQGGILKKIAEKQNLGGEDFSSLLLPMSFREGSPIHPAYGAGHATVAGACVTILKAFFKEEIKLCELDKGNGEFNLYPKKPVDHAKTGKYTELENLTTNEGAEDLTIGGELDKLAANISIGRNMAGVHWRSDYTQSILLGQRVAISMLFHQRRDHHERPWHFEFTSFGGNKVWIGFDPEEKDGVYFNEKQVLGPEHDRNTNADSEKISKSEAKALQEIV